MAATEIKVHERDERDVYSVFVGTCGHRWVAVSTGSWECAVCGLYDGDGHIESMESVDAIVIGNTSP